MKTAQKTILVVDDDQDIREIIMMILEGEGYGVLGLDRGFGVIDIVTKNLPNVILLDVQLGDMDGRDICKELKNQALTRDIPIIMISASHGWHALREKQCQADDYLAKPFDIMELVAHVNWYAA